ncbi:MAG: hypothetical protein K0U13_00190 [Chlamydiae bacterium]|nr:hypothetical protein [Chlamydiota bacterium]
MTTQERDRLVQELHLCWKKAYTLILLAQSDCQRILEVDTRQAARAAVEGAITGIAAARNPMGGIIGALIGTLANIGGQASGPIADAIRHACEARYWGSRFDEIYYKIQRMS